MKVVAAVILLLKAASAQEPCTLECGLNGVCSLVEMDDESTSLNGTDASASSTNTTSMMMCECNPGFGGLDCSAVVADCPDDSYCMNGGSCVKSDTGLVEAFECQCLEGFTGDMCQTSGSIISGNTAGSSSDDGSLENDPSRDNDSAGEHKNPFLNGVESGIATIELETGWNNAQVFGITIGFFAMVVAFMWCWCKCRRWRQDRKDGVYSSPQVSAPSVTVDDLDTSGNELI